MYLITPPCSIRALRLLRTKSDTDSDIERIDGARFIEVPLLPIK